MKNKYLTLTLILGLLSSVCVGQSKPIVAETMPLNSYPQGFTIAPYYSLKIDTVPCYMQVMYILDDKKNPIITTVWKSGYTIKRSDTFNVTYLNDFKEPIKNKVLISVDKWKN